MADYCPPQAHPNGISLGDAGVGQKLQVLVSSSRGTFIGVVDYVPPVLICTLGRHLGPDRLGTRNRPVLLVAAALLPESILNMGDTLRLQCPHLVFLQWGTMLLTVDDIRND